MAPLDTEGQPTGLEDGMKTIDDIVAAKKSPPINQTVARVIAFCEKMKFRDVIEKKELTKQLGLSPTGLGYGRITIPLADYRHVTRVGPEWKSFYGSLRTIQTLRRELSELEGNQ